MDDYDKVYAVTSDLFGANPEPFLAQHSDLIDRSAPVLDVGCGQGRNALFLAREGHRVVAIDPSATALEIVGTAAEQERLPVTTVLGGFEATDLPAEWFSAVCVFGLLQILTPAEIVALDRAITAWTRPGSLLFLSAWIDTDPRCEEIRGTWQALGGDCYSAFRHDDGRVRTYLRPGGIRDLFAGWQVIHHWEGLGALHRHGDGPEECHVEVHFVAERTE